MSNGIFYKNYPEIMNKFTDFTFPDNKNHDETFHNNLVNVYCEHLKRILEELSEDKGCNLEIIRPKSKNNYNKNMIQSLANQYYQTIEKGDIPAIIIKDIIYSSKFTGVLLGKNKTDKKFRQIYNKTSGQMDSMIITPLKPIFENSSEESGSYCILIEAKSSYTIGSCHSNQLENTAKSCVSNHLTKPFKISYIDGILTTPKRTERPYTYEVKRN